jgi:hypothetical protein
MPMAGQGQPGQVMYPGQVMMQQGPSGTPGYSQPQYAPAFSGLSVPPHPPYAQPGLTVPPPPQQSESEKLLLQASLDVVLFVA